MAELIIGNVVESITGDLLSVISEEIRLARVVKVELRKFQQTVSIIGIVLREAGKRQIEDENVNHWLMELIDVIYDADDLLGDFSTEVLRRRIVMGGGGNRILSEVSIFFSSSNQLVHQFKMAHRLKKMRERIDAISHDRSLFRIGGYNDLIGSLVENQVRPETSPYERWPYVIGRDKDKNEIIEFLLNTDFDENVTVLPIVGIGGLGKTTLARLVFNDKSVKEYFELKLWVCVSTYFDVQNILRKILRECIASEELNANLDMHELQEKLGEELHGKKFLLVLDDVWNENPRECLFPKDYVLEPRELVHLWMAQGYVNPLGSKRTIEEAGQDHFMELLSRGFFQDVEKEMYGNIVRCKMHYLMHDLAQSVAGNECITIDRAHEIMPQGGARHVSIIATEDYEWNRFERDGTIRSLLLIVEKRIEIGHLDISCFRNLRALRLQGVVWDVTFDSISELKHLRSLDLSKNDKLISLPNSISRLCNLETLNLRECLSLQKLPRGITKLVNLRQLDVSGCSRLTHMPRGIGKLTGLQMLSTFVVGAQWNSDAARFNELSKLTGLRNELAIQNLERSASISSEEDASCFMENFALQYLGLHWVWKGDTANERVDLERFRPHPDLRGLRIEGYSGVRFSSWVAQLDKLVVIEISDCPQCRYLPPLDDLHSLKRISLETLRNLEWIELSENSERLQSNFFPSLEEIELKHLDEFKGWRTGTGTEGEEHIQDEDDSSFFMLPIFSDKIKLSIDECPRFSYMHCQRLQLRGTTNKILQQLLRDVGCHATVPLSSQFTMAVPTPLMMMMMTSISYMSLSTLTSITIESVGDAKHLPVELFQSLPSLQSLAIKCWPCLKDASVRTILRCLTALKTLEISDCRALDLSTEDGDHSDDDDDDEDLHARRLQGHSKLQLVHIRGIHKMESLPWWFQHLSNLQELRISLCLGLKSLPGGVILRLLKTVRSLELHSCPELDLAGQEPEDQEDMPNLLSYRPTELQKLVFSDIRKMTTVPWWIQHLNNLEQLTLAACRNLKALPYWFPQLTSLKYLRVEDCGELSRRLKSNIGEDWPKISQIQSVSTE
ncbi:hypothetical protein CRG98_045630 [Punica granatum]|uniref:Disease resistance protein RGA3 n=1 Tax=Punica granatum TaxID=22663 RepID=A0A2I0HQM9_PUNGR|nr:hypothetical protein CRG98_045630 [Punica granatum]